jgi:drug/metabolite transporter (DMT)-like permease
MTPALATIFFGLAAALSWGSGDFCGGLASRRSAAITVVITAYTIGCLFLVTLALLWREPWPASSDWLWGIAAGISGGTGLLAFYSALAKGQMGIVASISAILTAGIPVLFSAFTQGAPGPLQFLGFGLAAVAIVLISRPRRSQRRPEGIWLAVLSGLGFGIFFICISRTNVSATFWPLAMARLTSVVFLLAITLIQRKPVRPKMSALLLIALAGVLDSLGNVCFVIAAHAGRLDIASVLSSLYPATTTLLAAWFLHEHLNRVQLIGVLLALLAVPLLSF